MRRGWKRSGRMGGEEEEGLIKVDTALGLAKEGCSDLGQALLEGQTQAGIQCVPADDLALLGTQDNSSRAVHPLKSMHKKGERKEREKREQREERERKRERRAEKRERQRRGGKKEKIIYLKEIKENKRNIIIKTRGKEKGAYHAAPLCPGVGPGGRVLLSSILSSTELPVFSLYSCFTAFKRPSIN